MSIHPPKQGNRPPPLPPSKVLMKKREDGTKSVGEVLKSCGCVKYEGVLFSEGFDSVKSLCSLEKDDLRAIGITESDGDIIRRAAERFLGSAK